MTTNTEEYNEICEALKKVKTPCLVRHTDTEYIIECGTNYPDKLFNKICNTLEKIGISDQSFSVCAKSNGPGRIASKHICGGPKCY